MSLGFKIVDLNRKFADVYVTSGTGTSDPLFANTGAATLMTMVAGYTSGPIGAGDYNSYPIAPATRLINPTAGPGPSMSIFSAGGFYPNTGDPNRTAWSMLYAGTGFTGAIEARLDLRDVNSSPVQFSIALNDVPLTGSQIVVPVSATRTQAISTVTSWIADGDDISVHVTSLTDSPTGSYSLHNLLLSVVPQ